MKIALLRCCVTPVFLQQYESSTDAVLEKLGVELVEIKEFNCCGYPLKNSNFKAFVLSSARNLALAEKKHLNIVTFCNCCYLTQKQANTIMKEDTAIAKEMNNILEKEGLKYEGNTEVRHLLEILYKDVGMDPIKKKLKKDFHGLKVAVHYGCHILRPSQLAQFDDPGTASIFDQLVAITGAENIKWKTQIECCGSPILGTHDDLSLDLTEEKLLDAKRSGADCVCVACPFCQLQFDRIQSMLLSKRDGKHQIPSIIFTQLLGLGLGIDAEILGIHENEVDMSGILRIIS